MMRLMNWPEITTSKYQKIVREASGGFFPESHFDA